MMLLVAPSAFLQGKNVPMWLFGIMCVAFVMTIIWSRLVLEQPFDFELNPKSPLLGLNQDAHLEKRGGKIPPLQPSGNPRLGSA